MIAFISKCTNEILSTLKPSREIAIELRTLRNYYAISVKVVGTSDKTNTLCLCQQNAPEFIGLWAFP